MTISEIKKLENDFNKASISEMLDSKYKNQAFNDVEIYGLDILDTGYYNKLREIYRNFKTGVLTKEKAESQKNKLQTEYFDFISNQLECINVYIDRQENIKKSSELVTKIEKSENIEEIADLSIQAIALMTGDKSFYERFQTKKRGGNA